MSQPEEIFVKPDRCMGCHSCELACAVAHSAGKTLISAMAEQPRSKNRIYVEWVAPDKNVPIVCRQCQEAPCLNACISGAISRNADGVVVTMEDKCIGCWTCIMVCPFGVIGRHLQKHIAFRCDRCQDQSQPACVQACPTQALVYCRADQLAGEVRQSTARQMITPERSE